jgi:uncharacterized membrane protein
MQNQSRTLHYVFAALAFVVSLVTYTLTVQPTVPFWDCGEFTAAAVQQQVPHPPGAPLFLMMGKVAHLIPFGDDGWRVNMVSVIASALTVLLLYLITEKVIKHFFLEDLNKAGNGLLVYGSALLAALTYTFTDTFWFNAVESEVYASSSLFVGLIVWIMMVWSDRADEPGHEKWLLLIAYVIGLSVGVHLLSILTVFSLVLLIYLRKYPVTPWGLVLTGVVGLVAFVAIYYFIILRLPAIFAGTFPFFKSEANEYPITDNIGVVVLGLAALAALGYAVWWGRKNNNGTVSLISTSILLMVLGYSTYAHILVRAQSNPPMNENKPDSFSKLVSYLGREQYGEAPMWPRRYQRDPRFLDAYKEAGKWYGIAEKRVTRKDGNVMVVPDYKNTRTNFSGEMKYMMDYQLNHMYWRYFLWNFSGRVSDRQDAPAYVPLATSKSDVEYWTHKIGFPESWPVNFWMLPLVLGLVGLVVHFQRDPRMAWVYLILFLMTGALAALQQNQQNPQPRERDYFYVASFMVFAMWIGIGFFGIVERWRENTMATMGALAAAILIIPVNMARQEWPIHSRAGNYMAFDYAYNILQSVEKDAIIFTNGDNDTFPVWYLQDVAGVRRDVRIVNLSLGQTTWYIEQLKNRSPWGAKKIPLSFSDESLQVSEEDRNALGPEYGFERVVEFPVKPEIIAKYTTDSALINAGMFRWTFKGAPRGRDQRGRTQYFIGVQHKLVRDIVEQTRFERPVYFSSSVGSATYADEYVGLGGFLRWEGMCLRVCPTPQSSVVNESVNTDIMRTSLDKQVPGNEFFKEPHYGLKLRNLGGGPTYYNDVHRSYVQSYRAVYNMQALYLLYEKRDTAEAARTFREMNKHLSLDRFPLSASEELRLAQAAAAVKDSAEMRSLAARALASATKLSNNRKLMEAEPPMDTRESVENIGAQACLLLGNWREAASFYSKMKTDPNYAPMVPYLIDEIEIVKKESAGDLQGALAVAEGLQSKYPMSADRSTQRAASELMRHISDLRLKLGLPPAPQPLMLTVPATAQ